MSSSAYKALFSYSGGQPLYFNTLKSESGWPEDLPELISEKLVAAGGDGARDRDVHFQYPDWTFRTTSDGVSLDDVKAQRDLYKAAQRVAAVGTLSIDLGGTYRSLRGLKIIRVATEVRAGSSAGFGSVSGSNGVIIAHWLTRFTEVPSTF